MTYRELEITEENQKRENVDGSAPVQKIAKTRIFLIEMTHKSGNSLFRFLIQLRIKSI